MRLFRVSYSPRLLQGLHETLPLLRDMVQMRLFLVGTGFGLT